MRSLSVAAMSLLFAGLLVPPPARAAMVVKGDPQAWSEVRTAMLRLVNAKTYRTKMTGTDGTTMVIIAHRRHAVDDRRRPSLDGDLIGHRIRSTFGIGGPGAPGGHSHGPEASRMRDVVPTEIISAA